MGTSGSASEGDGRCTFALGGKTARRIQVQTVCISIVFGASFLWTILVPSTSTPGHVDEPTSPTKTIPITSEEDLSALLADPIVVAPRRPRRLQDCAGKCVSKNEQDNIEQLRKSFIMVPYDQLEDPDAPRLKKSKLGFIPVYIFVIVYMFVALAIICDEFFVPALEAFVDEFGISMDVAGATFMAAGGSMPELFTAFISTFQGASEVGFAAIVGSAVFNVLFVIAVCAIFNPSEELTLTWWPLARDCSFYVIALSTVVIVFAGTSPGKIEAWEAVLLLCLYVCYCCFMRVNGRVQDFVTGMLDRRRRQRQAAPEDVGEPDDNAGTTAGDDGKSGNARSLTANSRAMTGASACKPSLSMPGTFRQGIVHLLTQNTLLYETAGIAAVVQVKGDLDETFKKLDADRDGYLSAAAIKQLLEDMGLKHDSAAIETAVRRVSRSADGLLSFDCFKKWYIASEARIEIEVRRVFDHFDHNHSNTIERDEIKDVMRSLGHKLSDAQCGEVMAHVVTTCNVKSPPGSADPARGRGSEPAAQAEQPAAPIDPEDFSTRGITFEQFEQWYTKSLFWQDKHKQHMNEAEVDEADEGLSLDPPEDAGGVAMFWYIFSYPLVAVLYCTLPDVRNPKWQRNAKIAVLEFALCLVWIGIFANMLYEATVVVSNTMRIPPPVSAVTVLAAGTSIPDLLSSYIVARNGESDMAVSSSIGSNIFDVTVGLPLPWLCYNIAYGVVDVDSDSIGFSVIVLIGMLIAVILTIVAMKWKMTKKLGYVMLALYFVFLAQDLCTQLPESDPLFRAPF